MIHLQSNKYSDTPRDVPKVVDIFDLFNKTALYTIDNIYIISTLMNESHSNHNSLLKYVGEDILKE